MAIVLDEPRAAACAAILESETAVIASATTIAEALIVANGKDLARQMGELLEQLGVEVIPVTAASARRVGETYARWGRGFHPAALNFGDCFAYEVATSRGCPLLFVGNDFAKTDVEAVL